MRYGRILRTELDLWRTVWQETDTFVDRIEGARDADKPHRTRMDALLRAARAVEHERRRVVDGQHEQCLSDPVIDALPGNWYDQAADTLESINEEAAWSPDYRTWRMPGSDAVELAVANIRPPRMTGDDPEDMPKKVKDVKEEILLVSPRSLFEIRVDDDDERYDAATDGLIMVRVPAYPAIDEDAIVSARLVVNIEVEDEDVPTSLFSREERFNATMADVLDESEEDEDGELVRRWSVLCAKRRTHREGHADARYVGPSVGVAWSYHQAEIGVEIANSVKSNDVPEIGGSTALTALAWLAWAANAGAAEILADKTDLETAAETLEEDGAESSDEDAVSLDQLLARLNGAASAVGGREEAFQAVAAAAGALQSTLGGPELGDPVSSGVQDQRDEAADDLIAALFALTVALGTTDSLFYQDVENGVIGPFLDDAIAARVAYPDGTLRIQRALELGLRLAWPSRRRWFVRRNRAVLRPLMQRLRTQMVVGLKALVEGGFTGLDCGGIGLGEDAPVGALSLITDRPQSMIRTLPLDVGQVGVLTGDRPAVVVVLGVGRSADRRMQLDIEPLRVSVAGGNELPGTAGLVRAGEEIACTAPGLQAHELRSGEADAGGQADGLIEGTLALWSRLCVVFGWKAVQADLNGGSSGTFAERLVPDPAATPIGGMHLHGSLETTARSVIIRGLGAEYWDPCQGPAEPLWARAGELLLVRGVDEDGVQWQGVVEVESSFGTAGSVADRMHDSVARLSTDPLVADEHGELCVVCGPQEKVVVLIFKSIWLDKKLVGDVVFHRDFQGFDLGSLAARTPLPPTLVGLLDPAFAPDATLRRDPEFAFASRTIEDWTRFLR